jgi:hypothetical protein
VVCSRFVVALQSLCGRFAVAFGGALQSLYIFFARDFLAIDLRSLCNCFVNTSQSLWNRFELCNNRLEIALQSFFNRFSIALQSPLNRFAVALQFLCSALRLPFIDVQ